MLYSFAGGTLSSFKAQILLYKVHKLSFIFLSSRERLSIPFFIFFLRQYLGSDKLKAY